MVEGSSDKYLYAHMLRSAFLLCALMIWGLVSGGSQALALSSLPTGVAVDNSAGSSMSPFAGNVYVASERGVAEFDSAGLFLTELSFSGGRQIAVDSSDTSSAGNVYVTDPGNGVVYELEQTGTAYEVVRELAGLSGVSGIAVDATGDVYVAEAHAGSVLEFSQSGAPLNEGKPIVEGLSEPRGIAVDAHGDLFLASESEMGTVELTPSSGGGFSAPKTIDGDAAFGVAVDSSTGDVYIGDSGSPCDEPGGAGFSIQELDSSGEPVGGLGCIAGGSNAIAESEATKTVYATDGDSFDGADALALVVLGVETDAAGCNPVNPASPTLCGELALKGGGQVDYDFEYGPTAAYGSYSPAALGGQADISSSQSSVQVSVEPSGLLPNTTYHYRLAAGEQGYGVTYGTDATFKTWLPQPMVDSESSADATVSGAMLSGTINPENGATDYHFEYGTSATYGSRTSTREAAASLSEVEVPSEQIGGLLPSTGYHYRLVAENATGVTDGPDQTFATPPSSDSETQLPVGGGNQPATSNAGQGQGVGSLTEGVKVFGLPAGGGKHTVPTRAQKLAKALKLCSKKPKRKQRFCEQQARKRYGAKTANQRKRSR